MTHKTIMRLITVLMVAATFCGCPSDNGANSVTPDNNNNTKITSLKTVIDNAEAESTIDLSQYSDITDYNVEINKTVRITNGSLGSGNITITSGGVELSGVSGTAKVTTNSSLRISGSSLSSLSIANVTSSSANRILSRAANVVTVDIADSTVDTVSMNIENSVLNVSGSETKITTIEVKVNVSIVLQDVNENNIALPKAGDMPQGITLTLKVNENDATEIIGNKSEGDSSSSSESGDSSSSSSSGDDSSSSSSSEDDIASGNISFGDDPMMYLVMKNDHIGNIAGDSWTFDLTSDLGVDVSGWTTPNPDTIDYTLSYGKHDLGRSYAKCVKNGNCIKFSIGNEAAVDSVLDEGYYQLFITVPVRVNGSDNTFTVAGTFDLYVE